MAHFSGVDHIALTVTDLDVSERFYTQVLGLLAVLDVGAGRVLMDTSTGFTIALMTHEGQPGTPFTERATGLDHVGFAVGSREELLAWQDRLAAAGVPYTPVRDLPLASHLSFRDPDGIALELTTPSEPYAAALALLRQRRVPDEEVLALASQMLGPDVVAQR